MIFSENKYCKQSGASWNSPDFNIFRLRFGQFMCTSLIKMFLYTNSTSEISLQVISSSLNQRKNYVVEKVQIHRDVAKLQWTKACGLLSLPSSRAFFLSLFAVRLPWSLKQANLSDAITRNLHVHRSFWYIFLPSRALREENVKCVNATFYWSHD